MFFHCRNRVFCGGRHLGGGALYSHLNDTSQSETTLSQNFSQTDEKAVHDAAILSGEGLGLDPENDPVIATTDWGLDIKFHAAAEYQGVGYSITNPSNGKLSSGALNGYAYVTMGTYSSKSVNWVIIGYSTNIVTVKSPVQATNLGIPDTSPAGTAAKADSSKAALISTQYKVNPIYATNAVGTSEIPAGCVLCISETNICTSQFQTNTTWSNTVMRYYGSVLATTVNNLYSSGLSLSTAQKNRIQSVELISSFHDCEDGYNNYINYTSSGHKFFVLATNNGYLQDVAEQQNFKIETYLNTNALRISYAYNSTTAEAYWTRTSWRADTVPNMSVVNANGTSGKGYNMLTSQTRGVRPAFCLKIF